MQQDMRAVIHSQASTFGDQEHPSGNDHVMFKPYAGLGSVAAMLSPTVIHMCVSVQTASNVPGPVLPLF